MGDRTNITKTPGEDESFKHNLYDNIILDVYEKQLQQNLLSHKQTQKIYDEIVAKEKQKIDEQFIERKKLLDAQKRIHKSSLINKSHMIKSQLKFKMCQQVFTSVLLKIQQKIQEDQNEHSIILIKLIVEGALRMFEPELEIRCLVKHMDIIQNLLKDSEQSFNHVMIEQTGRSYPIKLKIKREDALKERKIDEKLQKSSLSKKRQDQQCIGGVILADKSGNIIYKNTFDTRINILREIALPMMRVALWPSFSKTVNNQS